MPFAGVLPWLADVWLDAEDTLAAGRGGAGAEDSGNAAGGRGPAAPGLQRHRCRRPGGRARGGGGGHHRPGHRRRRRPGRAARLAGHRERSGLAAANAASRGRSSERARRGAPVLGICGGYQMLGATIADEVETRRRAGRPGSDLLPVRTTFAAEKVLGRPSGSWRGHPVTAYEIHHGVAEVGRGRRAVPGRLPGRPGLGHHVARRLRERRVPPGLAERGRPTAAGLVLAAGPGRAGLRRAGGRPMIDTLADAVDAHLDLDLLLAGTRVAGSRSDDGDAGAGDRHRQRPSRAPDRPRRSPR